MNEIWKDITGFEGLYQVSDLGRVRSLWFGKKKVLKPKKNSNGYFQIGLHKDGKTKQLLIHRLVAKAFIPNPLGYPVINHRDENPLNNIASNLEWCSQKYNVNYGQCLKRRAMKFINGPLAKPVLQYDKQGNFLRRWPSIQEVTRQLGFNDSHIWACCNGKHKSAYGFVWKYA